jgi:hypothetical protein
LGQFWAESGQGPNVKVVLLCMLYKFHLSTKGIGLTDYAVMIRQNGIINVSATINNIPNCCEKWSPTSVIFLHALLHDISSIFCIWTNSSCIEKFGEREMPTSTLLELGLKMAKC